MSVDRAAPPSAGQRRSQIFVTSPREDTDDCMETTASLFAQRSGDVNGQFAGSTMRTRSTPPFRNASARRSSPWVMLHQLNVHLLSEWTTLTRTSGPRPRWRRPALTLGIVACVCIGVAAWLQQVHPGIGRLVLGEQASLWWPVAIIRLPGSMFAPALRLPMWGALAQVLFCFGLAETHLGRRTTLLIIGLTHGVATASARVFLALGPHAPFHLGLPQWVRWERDTGPSAAVVGLATYLGITLRVPVLTSLLVAVMAIETLVQPDLADREHLVAIAVGGLAAIAVRAYQGADRLRGQADARADPTNNARGARPGLAPQPHPGTTPHLSAQDLRGASTSGDAHTEPVASDTLVPSPTISSNRSDAATIPAAPARAGTATFR